MATKKKEVAKGKVYKGSKQNGGREIIVEHYKDDNGKWHTTSKNAARAKYEKEHGKLRSRNQTVDHINSKHSDNRSSNLQVLDKGKNTAKENKRRAGKKKK
jgi:hypothetical protein